MRFRSLTVSALMALLLATSAWATESAVQAGGQPAPKDETPKKADNCQQPAAKSADQAPCNAPGVCLPDESATDARFATLEDVVAHGALATAASRERAATATASSAKPAEAQETVVWSEDE